MSRVPDQEPIETTSENDRDGTRSFEHPAFGQIRVSRVSGHAVLYDSDFTHQQYVTVSICGSVLKRSLARDWTFSKKEYIEVAMSEAQWATFISSMNQGCGVPCTVTRRNGDLIPQIAQVRDTKSVFANEVRAEITKSLERLQAVSEKLSQGAISKTKAAELAAEVTRIREGLPSCIEFVGEQFSEHMENVVEKGKSELSAFAMHIGATPSIALAMQEPARITTGEQP